MRELACFFKVDLGRLNHEKCHALCHLSPEGIMQLQQCIRNLGFAIIFKEQNEEMAATIVHVLSIYLSGAPLENIGGSDLIVRARDTLRASRLTPQH